MRRVSSYALLIVCLATSLFAKPAELREARERDRSLIERVVRTIVKLFRPATTGDLLSPPKP